MGKFEPPYFGAAYYPEVWDEKTLDQDIRLMKDMGVNTMRLGEFAWVFMEPREGKYEFEWLHRAVKKLSKAGISIVLGTPTATLPVWLTDKYPDVFATMDSGFKYGHGNRRHYCPNSSSYRKFSRRITEQLAKEFGHYESVVGWQIDNELGAHVNTCYCDQCKTAFHKFLRKRYGTIENLNEKWGTGVWSLKFSKFEEVQSPRPLSEWWHHASLLFNFKFFMSRSYSECVKEQADIIRKYSKAPITTNGMNPYHHLDYEEMFSHLDFASDDLYFPPAEMYKLCFEADWMRSVKKRPYWIMETSSTFVGGRVPAASYMHDKGSLHAKCWLFYAMGGEGIMFWLWRSHWSGQEMESGSLVYPWGEPTFAEGDIKTISSEINKLKKFLTQTRPQKPEVAMHFSYQCAWVFTHDYLVRGFNYIDPFYEFHRIFVDSDISRDVIFPHADVSGYKVILSPYMVIIPDQTRDKMEAFVRKGGTWIIGPMAGFRTEHSTAYKECAYGPLEKLIGAHVRHRFLPPVGGGNIDLKGYKEAKCIYWCDAFTPEKDTKVIARYGDGPAKGMAAIVECSLGKGRIITIGTQLDQKTLSGWLNGTIAKFTKPDAITAEKGIVAVRRANKKNRLEGVVLIDISGNGGKVGLPEEGIDLLSGKKAGKDLKIPPYGVKIIGFRG